MLVTQVPVLLQGYDAERTTFLNQVRGVLGKSAVACYLPHRNDTLTSIDPISARVWTADATMAGQITPLGKGSQRTFNGTSNYLTTPDTADMSFVEPAPFSVFAVGNVTDTAVGRTFISKLDTNQQEWATFINAADSLRLTLTNLAGTAPAAQVSNAVITQGSLHSFSSTYDGVTGGPPANMVLYQDGALIASTASGATYAGMANGTAASIIGANSAGTAAFFQGTIAFVLVAGVALTAAQNLNLHNLARNYFQF